MYLSRNQLKLLAVLFMVIDHTGYFLLENSFICRAIGRLSFPLFIYLIVDGYHQTRSVKRYGFRLMLLWIVSIVPYSLAFYGQVFSTEQNIFLSLYLYLVIFCVFDNDDISPNMRNIFCIFCLLFAHLFTLSYGCYGVLLSMILMKYEKVGRIESFRQVLLISIIYALFNGTIVQVFACLSILLLPDEEDGFIPSNKPSAVLSVVFYLFYPVHLLFFAFLCRF